ncbi:MAG: HNH endonuclease domain-containing protein [Flavobacterium sp.]
MHLPSSSQLPIDKLAAVFSSTVATYKFYWLLAIVELVEEGATHIEKRKIFARMIANSWYTINYFHLSFGKQDLLQIAVETILKSENLTIDSERKKVIKVLESSQNSETIRQLNHFDKNVPHWFLSPWFPKAHKAEIYKRSAVFENGCPYFLSGNDITINPIWINYLQTNSLLLKHFCYWNLALFLQRRNPNVPDIPNKLIKSPQRVGLTKQLKEYWKPVFEKHRSLKCIFTGTELTLQDNNFALDHFVPYAFVSHDLIWNLLPIERKFNSSKSDKLPNFEKYFPQFYSLQKEAFDVNRALNEKNKYLEEFLPIFPSLDDFGKKRFSETIQPLITIASNNGFLYMND